MNRTLVCCAAMSMFCSLMLAGCKTQSSAPAPREPLPVDIVAVKAADEAHWLETIGQAEAAAAVSVTTQATGRIIAQRYTEGDFVEAGAVLFEIDPANLKTQLASAEASRRALEVEFAQADREFQRAEKLWKAQAASQKDYDDAKSLKNKTANELAQARAAENEARINLDWTAVRAPASGYVSKALFNPGSVVVKDSTVLATITQKNDVRVLFAPSDRDLAGADISTATRVRVFRASGEELPASLDYVAQTFDAKNGTRTMRAKIPADSGVLPGEFLRIRFMTAVDRGAWRVPQRCVKQLPDGTYAVFVMQDGKAIQKAVEVGLWEGTDWIVTKGLADGDLVITNQLIKLQNGTAIRISAVPRASSKSIYLVRIRKLQSCREVKGATREDKWSKERSCRRRKCSCISQEADAGGRSGRKRRGGRRACIWLRGPRVLDSGVLGEPLRRDGALVAAFWGSGTCCHCLFFCGGDACDDVGPHRSAMGARGGSPIRKIQSRFGPWLVLDYSHHRAERHAGGHENQVDDIWRGGDSHFRSCPHQCERCSVLDGVGCEGGLYRGGRLLPRG